MSFVSARLLDDGPDLKPAYTVTGDAVPGEHWRAVEGCVAAIEQRWGEPDAGIWELDNTR